MMNSNSLFFAILFLVNTHPPALPKSRSLSQECILSHIYTVFGLLIQTLDLTIILLLDWIIIKMLNFEVLRFKG